MKKKISTINLSVIDLKYNNNTRSARFEKVVEALAAVALETVASEAEFGEFTKWSRTGRYHKVAIFYKTAKSVSPEMLG